MNSKTVRTTAEFCSQNWLGTENCKSDITMQDTRKVNSTDYFVNIQLISFISSCLELKDKLGSEITTLKNG